MRTRVLSFVVALALLSASAVLVGQRAMTLGSIAPANSLWDRALKQMATDVQAATERRVRIRVASMTQGDESAIVRRLLLGTTQVASLTLIGLSELDESFDVLGMPFFFSSDAEARHVLGALEPRFVRGLEAQNLVLINWGHTGWAHLFSAERISSLAELRDAKLFTSAGDDRVVRWFRENGFNPVPLSLSDVPVGLNTGLINAYPFPPYAALLLQYYRPAPHMLDLPLGPVLGATVMHKRHWYRLSPEDREAIMTAGQELENGLFKNVPVQDTEAVEEMKTRGLEVTELSAAELTAFRTAADEMNASMRGTIVAADVFDEAIQARDAFRAQ
jgi:TRAP-type C4-dicarboxylate transport system substrate-binding protein